MFKEIVDDGHLTTLKAPLEHVVLRWAKNLGLSGKILLIKEWTNEIDV